MKESQPYCLCKGEDGSKFKGWTGLTNYLGIETSRERHDLSFRDSNLMRNLALRSLSIPSPKPTMIADSLVRRKSMNLTLLKRMNGRKVDYFTSRK